MLESQFQSKVIKFLKSCGANVWHFKVWGGGFQKSGIPDLIACVNGYFVAIELKKEGGTPSPLQLRNDMLIKKANGISYILYPNEFESFKVDIKELISEK